MREARQEKPPLQLQAAHPPDWLPEAHTSADLGTFIVLRSYGIRGPWGRTVRVPRIGHISQQLSEYTDVNTIQVVLDTTSPTQDNRRTS